MKKLLTIIIIVAIIIGAYYLFSKSKSEKVDFSLGSSQDLPFEIESTEEEMHAQAESISKLQANQVGVYEHSGPNFSFSYPDDFTIGTFPERDGEVVLVQGKDKQIGLQIFTAPFDESRITLEGILRDIPDIEIYDARPVEVGSGGGVAFIRKDSSGNLTREIWFVYNGHLFQMTSFAKYEGLLTEVLQTFQFKF